MWKRVRKRFVEMWKPKWKIIREVLEVFFLLLEIHFFKILFFITFWTATSQVHIVNMLILILLSIATYNKSASVKYSITIFIALLSIAFICATFMNRTTMRSFESRVSLDECQEKEEKRFGFIITEVDTWFEWEKERLWPYFGYLFMVMMFYMLKRHQQKKRLRLVGSSELPKEVFAGISRENAETSLENLIKFLANYGFYKFGIEITLIMFIIVIFTRLEIFTVFYIFWLVLIVFRNRDKAESLWKVATFLVLTSIIVQSLMLGLFVVVKPCKVPFGWSIDFILFFIFDNSHSLNDKPVLILGDFVLLILMTSQLAVFQQEKSRDTLKPFEFGGSNRTILTELIYIDGLNIFEHSIYTFGDKFQGFVDVLKWFIFKLQFWMSLATIFLLGTLNVDVFSLGYVSGAFVFLWQGTSFFKKNIRGIITWWNVMLIFNLSSFIIKILLKVSGCNFGEKIPRDLCWIADLLHIPCSYNLKGSFCESFKKYSPFLLDSLVFVVIIMQRRIFLSYYFFNVINETFLNEILASRGAEVVEDLRLKEVNKQRVDAEEELKNLKSQMEKIKRSANAVKMRPSSYHDHAILNGGYYMFDDEEEKKPMLIKESQIASKQTMSIMSVKVTAKIFLTKMINELILMMHNKSENYISILQILEKEKKILKMSMSPRVYSSREAIEQKISRINRDRQAADMRRVDNKLKQLASSALRKKESKKPDAIMYKVGKETFYFLLSYTDVLAYCAVCLVQIQTSSLLTLPVSFCLFLWATMTFPRPSKTFWTLLIAYTQIVVIIKLISQSDLCWWDSENYYIKVFGLRKQTNFAGIELLLLMLVFLHRSMLMMLGLWTSINDFRLSDGKFSLIDCDAQTSELIKLSLKESEARDDESVVEDTSKDLLISNDDEMKKRILFKDEVKVNYEDGKKKVKPVFKDRAELLKAEEITFTENDGNDFIKLSQDEVQMKLGILNTNLEVDVSRIVVIETYVEEPSAFYWSIIWLSVKKHCYMLRNIFSIISPKQVSARRKRVDVYTLMFFCEVINFLVLVFGFSEFVVQSNLNDQRSIIDYLKQNKVPKPLLLLLVIQFAMIIIDRVLYMRKSMAGKIIFHVFTIFYTHIWMFMILPACTGETLNETSLPKLYYIIKCCYMLLSAYQIRYGYPRRIMGNFIMKNYGYAWMIGFKIYMNIPMLFEIRTLIDWMCTETSLDFSEWVRVESIYAQVYQIKCQRLFAEKSNLSGEKKTHWQKYLLGGALTSLLIGIIFFPLILFALSSELGKPNIPNEITMSLQLGSYEPIYEFEASQTSIRQFSESEWTKTLNLYDKSPSALLFLKDYQAENFIAANFGVNSSSSWNISPPNAQKIVSDIKNGTLNYCQLNWKMSRKSFGKVSQEIVQSSSEVLLDENARRSLILMLENIQQSEPVVIKNIFQKIVSMHKDGKISIVSELLSKDSNGKFKRDLSLQLHRSNMSDWWEVKETSNDKDDILKKLPYQNPSEVVTLFMFNENSFPSQFTTLAVKGIVGLYVTLLVFITRFLRSSFFNLSNVSIIVEELPNVDRIISLCQDIYLVRESQEFLLEEDLVAKLLFLYRSPETLIKWTMLKDE